MAATSQKSLEFVERRPDLRRLITLAKDDAIGTESPAIALQELVEQAYSASYPEPHVIKWPASVRLLLLSGLCVATWSLIIIGVRPLLQG